MPALTPGPAFASLTWVAKRLGIHPDTFRRHRLLLTKKGFPVPDPLLGRYLVADVEAWIQNQRKILSPGESLAGDPNQEVNHDAL